MIPLITELITRAQAKHIVEQFKGSTDQDKVILAGWVNQDKNGRVSSKAMPAEEEADLTLAVSRVCIQTKLLDWWPFRIAFASQSRRGSDPFCTTDNECDNQQDFSKCSLWVIGRSKFSLQIDVSVKKEAGRKTTIGNGAAFISLRHDSRRDAWRDVVSDLRQQVGQKGIRKRQ